MKKTDTTTQEAKRPPIVVVLGHVDHGKSSLLEAIREEFRITARESGGITQHIGAYVATYEGKHITFLDTPGHEAFSAMRSRGAKVADIGILVVAADDGVKQQTKEAIAQAQVASLPFLVAITKIDKPAADPARVRNELAKEGIVVESMGGQVPCVETSSQTKQGMKELLEMILLMADLQDLSARPEAAGKGVVIEVSRDAKRGIQTTLLVKEGVLRAGDAIGTPTSAGKIKVMEDFLGKPAQEITSSFPALVIGFEASPFIGEEFSVFSSLDEARAALREAPLVQVEDLSEEENVRKILLKADVAGSLEAATQMINATAGELRFQVLKGDVGDVTEGDVKFARDTGASIIAFRVKISAGAARLAELHGIAAERFEVIYDIAERLQKLSEEAHSPAAQELGTLRVLATFSTDRDRRVVGGRVITGMIKKGAAFEIVRQDVVVGKGKLVNLQQQKKDAVTVSKGNEAGLMVQTEDEIKQEDILKFFVS